MSFLTTLLAAPDALIPLVIILPIVTLAIGGGVGYFVPYYLNKKKIGEAKITAEKMLEDAASNVEVIKKEAIIEAKEEIHKLRSEFDKEVKDRRGEIQRTEQRLIQKEDTLDKKELSIDRKLENVEGRKKNLENKIAEVELKESKIDELTAQIGKELERVANLTREEAKALVISEITDEAKRDAAVLVREIERQAKEESDKKAKEIIGISIQKCAADHVAEMTVSVVPLPSDDMKGRIIGREGRNIRALESATGIDLIIDDTPEAVVLSGFDPVRREVARIALEKLINDGRIHPARIEEIVEKTRKEVEAVIKETGESAMFEAGLHQLHPELIKLLGRLKYRTSYGQNILKHSLEVAHLSALMATELGGDVNVARRGGLLHDIGKAVDHETEGTHISIGVDLATKFKESKAVIHCIAAHHNDIEPKTLEAILVQAADAISSARPGARRESLESYVKRLEALETIANSFDGVEKSFAIQAGREVRIIVKPEMIDDNQALFLAKDIARKIEKEMEYPGQIKVNVIRESRSVDYAK